MKLTEEERKQTGLRIKQIRLARKLSMQEFAKLVDPNGKAQSGTVANWETGKNAPNKKRLEKIAKIGDVSVDFLVNGFTSEKAKEIKKLRNKFSHGVVTNDNDLSENDKRLIKESSIDTSVLIHKTSNFEINQILNTFSLENIEKIDYSQPSLLGFAYFASMFVSALKNTELTNNDDDIVMELINLIDNVKIAIHYNNEDDKISLRNKLNTINNELEKTDDN